MCLSPIFGLKYSHQFTKFAYANSRTLFACKEGQDIRNEMKLFCNVQKQKGDHYRTNYCNSSSG